MAWMWRKGNFSKLLVECKLIQSLWKKFGNLSPKKAKNREFLGVPVVRTLNFQCRRHRFDP